MWRDSRVRIGALVALAVAVFIASGSAQTQVGNFLHVFLNGNRLTATAGTAVVTVPNSTDTLVGRTTTDTVTNKTLDTEATGNVLTVPFTLEFQLAICLGGVGYTNMDLQTSGTDAPTPACIAGTSNGPVGVLDFFDTNTEYVYNRFMLPADWTGAIDLRLYWMTTATTGNVVWQIQTTCVADTESIDPTWNTAQTIIDAAQGTASRLNVASLTGITTTGCAAGELFKYRILRDPAHASDTIAATARLVNVELKIRRAL